MNIAASTRTVENKALREGSSQSRVARIENVIWVVGRTLVALLFVLSGPAKIISPKPFLNHMVEVAVPTFFLPAVIALELGAGLALLVGWRVREAAWALAIFCMMTAAIFHHQVGISAERTSFFKDLAIAGGLLAIGSRASSRTRARAADGAGS